MNSCEEIPEVFCKCQGEPEPMCRKHISNHYLYNEDKLHILFPAFRKISSNLKEPIIEYFRDLIIKNKEMKRVVIEETENLLKLSNELVKYFEKFNKFILFNIGQMKLILKALNT